LGLTQHAQSAFLNESHFCYTSGNAVVVVDTSEVIKSNQKQKNVNDNNASDEGQPQPGTIRQKLNFRNLPIPNPNETIEPKQVSKKSANERQNPSISSAHPHSVFAVAESSITALATYSRENVIAFADKDSRMITVMNWPSRTRIGPKDGELPGNLPFKSIIG
jgi:hypothetical protein